MQRLKKKQVKKRKLNFLLQQTDVNLPYITADATGPKTLKH